MNKLLLAIFSMLILSCGNNKSKTEQKEASQEQPKSEENSEEKGNSEENNGMQKLLMQKQKEGVDFYAVGNEPFWSLEMDLDNSIYFNTMNGIDFRTPSTEPEKAQDADVTRYRAVVESGEIIVQLKHEECEDSMADNRFPYQVQIDYKTTADSEYKTFKGCGQFIPDYRVHNIWSIKEVDGMAIAPDTFKKKQPIIEFDLTTNRLMGNNGCNSFRGPVEVQNDKIVFGVYAATLMACMDNEIISDKIMETLSNTTLDYKFENNRLMLSENDEVKMVLQNVD